MKSRLFKIRMRPGRALMGATNDGTEAPQGSSGQEVVVDERTAAFLIRHRAAEVIETIDASPVNPKAT
jgi:hypothetical protein